MNTTLIIVLAIVIVMLIIAMLIILLKKGKTGTVSSNFDPETAILKEKLANIEISLKKLDTSTIELKTENTISKEYLKTTLVENGNKLESINRIFNNSKHRGNIGEYALELIMENAFGVEGKTWKRQYKLATVTSEDYQLNNGIVDAILFTGINDENIAIDAKFPLTDFQALLETKENEKELYDSKKKDFISSTKTKIKDLTKYINAKNKISSVVMFLPSESVFVFIMNECPELFDYATNSKIWLAGPSTLTAIFKTQSLLIKEHERNESVKEIIEMIEKIQEDLKRFIERKEKLQDTYDEFKSKMDKAFKDVKITSDKLDKQIDKINENKK